MRDSVSKCHKEEYDKVLINDYPEGNEGDCMQIEHDIGRELEEEYTGAKLDTLEELYKEKKKKK